MCLYRQIQSFYYYTRGNQECQLNSQRHSVFSNQESAIKSYEVGKCAKVQKLSESGFAGFFDLCRIADGNCLLIAIGTNLIQTLFTDINSLIYGAFGI